MASPAREAPLVLGRYVLHDRIAAGGMAAVHLGRLLAPAGFSRTVAVKRLHPHFALDPEFVVLFTDEARLASRIRHPNVIPTIDVVAEAGELFLVMEYVEGETLSYLLRAQRQAAEDPSGPAIEPMSAPMVSAVMTGILFGLHAAHEATGEDGLPAGIVHRDVSPQNILVGVDGVARLLDFGVSRATGQLHTTREGVAKGKLPYMAPEQATNGTANRQTDIFSAAVVLWEALTGQRLFHGDNDAVIYTQLLERPVDPPSRLATGLPRAVDRVVMRGLDRDPARRFATAGEMAVALEDAIAPTTPRRVGDWVRRVAAERLEQRAELISKLESTASSPAAFRADAAHVAREPVDEPQTSSVSVEHRLRGTRRSRRTWVAGGTALLALGLAAAVTVHGRHGPETTPPVEATPTPRVPAATAVDTSSAAAPTVSVSPPSVTPAPTAPESAIVPRAVAQPAATAHRRRLATVAAPSANSSGSPPAPKSSSEPIYTRE